MLLLLFNNGEAVQAVSAADYKTKKKYIIRKDEQLLVFENKQDALDLINADKNSDATSELNVLIDIDLSEKIENTPTEATQALQPVYDINAMLQALQNNAQAARLLNARNYQALLALYEQFIDDEEVELLLMAA